MAKTRYRISGAGDDWTLQREGATGTSYMSQEAAFEVAVLDASNEMRAGNEIVIEVLRDAENSDENDRAANR